MIYLLTLSDKEWLIISDIILNINSTNDEEMRMSFLKKLEGAVPFDIATFFIGSNAENQKTLITPIVYKHPFERISNPNDLFSEYENIQKGDYGNWAYWLPNSTVFRDTDILSDSIRKDTDIYKKIYSPVGMHYGCVLNIVYDNILLGVVCLYREKGSSDFSDRDVFILNYIKPHLTYRMYQLHPQGKNQINLKGTIFKEYNLTQREFEIIILICKGYSNKEISENLFICEDTVKKHLQHIYKKININCRSKLIRIFTEKNYKLSTFNYF